MLRLTDSSRRIKLQEKCVGYTITTVVLRYSMTTKVKKESTMYLMKFWKQRKTENDEKENDTIK